MRTTAVRALALSVALLACAAMDAAGEARAIEVTNPGPTTITIDSGFIKVGDGFEEAVEGLPADPVISGSLDAAGAFSAPATGFAFPALTMQVPNPFGGTFTYSVEMLATGPVSGTLDPISGVGSLAIDVKVKVTQTAGDSLGDVGPNCFIGTDAEPISLRLSTRGGTTETADPDLSQGGRLYSPDTGTARLADNAFAVPGPNGCTGVAGGQLDDVLGIPSASGNGAEFDVIYAPAPTSPPGVSFVSTPQATTEATTAEFEFASNLPAGTRFECRLDGGEPQECDRTVSYSGLALGPHTFRVAGYDPDQPEAPPVAEAEYTWQIVPPTGPPLVAKLDVSSAHVAVTQPVTFSSEGSTIRDGLKLCASPSEPACGYRWDLDGDGVVDRVTNIPTTQHRYLTIGARDVEVTIFEIGGESDTARATVVVEEPPEVKILNPPPASIDGTEWTFLFAIASNPYDATTECSLDGAPFAPCSSGALVRVPEPAQDAEAHVFAVRGVTPGGVVGPADSSRWTVRPREPEPRPQATYDGRTLAIEVEGCKRRIARCTVRSVAITGRPGRPAQRLTGVGTARLRGSVPQTLQMTVKKRHRAELEAIAASERKVMVRLAYRFRRKGKRVTSTSFKRYSVGLAG